MYLIRTFDISPLLGRFSERFSADFIMCPEHNNKTWIIIFSHRFLSCCYCSSVYIGLNRAGRFVRRARQYAKLRQKKSTRESLENV